MFYSFYCLGEKVNNLNSVFESVIDFEKITAHVQMSCRLHIVMLWGNLIAVCSKVFVSTRFERHIHVSVTGVLYDTYEVRAGATDEQLLWFCSKVKEKNYRWVYIISPTIRKSGMYR